MMLCLVIISTERRRQWNMELSIDKLYVIPRSYGIWQLPTINSSLSGQNCRNFADDIFRCIFVNEMFCILIKITLKFVLKGPIENNPALVLNFIPIVPISNIPAFGSDNGLSLIRCQAIIWTNADLIHWRRYAALGEEELMYIPSWSGGKP